MIDAETPDDPARELRRVVARLVALGPDRLSRPGPDDGAAAGSGASVTAHDAVHAWLQDLADLTADASSSTRRLVPRLRPHAVPDQVVVLVHEALAVGASGAPGEPLTAEVARRLLVLRRAL